MVFFILHLVSGRSGILAAETGNSKTLAFLLPLIQKVVRLKEAIRQVESDRRLIYLNRPLAVVIAPSRELAHQIYQMAKDLCMASDHNTVPTDSSSHFKAMGLDVRLALGGSLDQKMSRWAPLSHSSQAVFLNTWLSQNPCFDNVTTRRPGY